MKIGEVSERSGLSIDTLRYYEKIGLIRAPARDGGGRRSYGADILDWIAFLERLKATGMPMAERLAYAALREQGDVSRPRRRVLLEAHHARVSAQVCELQGALDLLSQKIAAYGDNPTETDHDRSKDDPGGTP